MTPTSVLVLGYAVALTAAATYPKLQYDPDTISTCAEWWDNGGSETCEYVRNLFDISPQLFHTWNPSVGLDCTPWQYQSYCILSKERLSSLTATQTTTTHATTTTKATTTTTHAPTPTAWQQLGCYVDDDASSPVLEKQISSADAALTIAKCETACWQASGATVLYAGVKAGNQCWCGSFVGGEGDWDDTKCNTPCTGDKAAVCGGKDRIQVFEPVAGPRTTTTTSPAACATDAMGLASPRPEDADCNVLALSGGGTTIQTFVSGDNVASLAGCASVCLSTTNCTNVYYTQDEHCNLHAGADTHKPNLDSVYTYYDARCFFCESSCRLTSPQPTNVECGVLAYSHGGTALLSRSAGPSIQSAVDCAELCSATTGCTNFYFTPGQYCNLKSGAETHKADPSSPFLFYDASCFKCVGKA
ncbi:putative WSC domain protein [Rosellinia necatrix]|uniref:Putative WSC domain protein n=1 Tax=Rosellinia necatrix TaxID=77044 RepID=A0A1W2TQM6_ROSNE|nr:putative WSC domain protein [Rosellinia necatrix]